VSLKAFLWAGEQDCARPADKLILLGLAECHSTANLDLFPSVMWIEEYSGLDRKTVLKGLERLRESGQIIDTGRRMGRGVIVYRFAFDAPEETSPKNGTGTSPKNGTANEADLFGSGPVFPSDRSQKRDEYRSQKRDTEAVKGSCKGSGEDARPPAPGALGTRPPARSRATRTREGKRASSLPKGFMPVLTEGAQKIVDRWPPGMLDTELDKFRDRHISKGSTFKDWQAAFRTWIHNAENWRNERGASGGRSGAKGSGSGDGFTDAIREHRNQTNRDRPPFDG
jgi:hypothetical protein